MGVKRIGNSRYQPGINVLGHKAWLVRPGAEVSREAGSAANLLDVSDDGVDDGDELAELPKPSRELLEELSSESNWAFLDLSGLDLREVWAKHPPKRIDGADLSGCDLRGVSFAGVEGVGVDMTGARTRGALMHKWVNLSGVKTGGAFDMTDVVLGDSGIVFAEPTRLTGLATMTPSEFGGWGASAVLGNADFSGETIDTRDISGFSEVENARFTNTVFVSPADDARPLPQSFNGIVLTGCDFTGASMRGVELRMAAFEGCEFRNADLSGWMFDGGARFVDCDFGGADMSNWGFTDSQGWNDASFRGENIFDGVNLTGASGKVVWSMNDQGCWYEQLTVRQAAERVGMDPEEFGMLAWAGEIEVRDKFYNVVVGFADDSVHVPPWVVERRRA